MDIKYGKDLQIGNLILISEANYLFHAIYAGEGNGHSIQYYSIERILHIKKLRKTKVYKSYLIRPILSRNGLTPIARFDENNLLDKDKDEYLEALDYLKQIGKI